MIFTEFFTRSRSSFRLLLASLPLLAATLAAAAPTPPVAWQAEAEGFVLDTNHPSRPRDTRVFEARVRVTLDASTGEGEIAFFDKDDLQAPPDRRFWRRGRMFNSNDSGEDLPAEEWLNLPPATIAVLHPALLEAYLRERAESADTAWGDASARAASPRFIAMGDVLWRVESSTDPASVAASDARQGGADAARPRIAAISRVIHDDVHGAMIERVAYEGSNVTVTRAGAIHADAPWVIASLSFGAPTAVERYRTPKGERARDAVMVIPKEEFVFRDLGGGLFACELERANARVFVVEFERELLVYEGVFSSRNAETLAAAIRERFRKPVRFFAFSHIHPQYLAGIRVWAGEGATLLTPPSSVQSITDTLAAPFQLRPDAWSRAPGTPRLETIPERLSREDSSASVVVINNPRSDHTDEYLNLYFPRTKTLLSGDLLFYRPGQPLWSRSLTLARYVRDTRLDVDRIVTTWPLVWPGKNELTGDEFREGLKAGEEYEAKSRAAHGR